MTDTKPDVFNTGAVYRESQQAPLPKNADERTEVFHKWPEWCIEMKAALGVKNGDIKTPELLDWHRDGDREVFEVNLPGSFNNPDARQMIPNRLAASRGAESAIGLKSANSRLRIVLSYFSLPDVLAFDEANIPTNPDIVDLGLLSEGSRLLWDTKSVSHGLIAGQTNSGKSDTAGMVLAQLHLRGWGLLIVTPKRNDPTFQAFAKFPQHQVITGLRDEDLEHVRDMLAVEFEETQERQELRGDFGVDWWDELAGELQEGRPRTMLVIDESRDYFEIDGRSENKERMTLKAEITRYWVDRCQKGRSERQHCLALTQTPYVDAVGGGFAWNQLGFRLAVRSLSPDFAPRMFHKAQGTAIEDVLFNPATKPGRGVARGAAPPDNEMGTLAVNDAPVQIAYLPRGEREVLLGLREAQPEMEELAPSELGEGVEEVEYEYIPPPPPPMLEDRIPEPDPVLVLSWFDSFHRQVAVFCLVLSAGLAVVATGGWL